MDNPVTRGCAAILWCVLALGAVGCASASGGDLPPPVVSVARSAQHGVAPSAPPFRTTIAVGNSQSSPRILRTADGTLAHAVPALDGLGLLLLASLLGVAALWMWRGRQ